ncbi:MAG: hypothetical protein ABW061_18775 [Polyangiaceae bacterium]
MTNAEHIDSWVDAVTAQNHGNAGAWYVVRFPSLSAREVVTTLVDEGACVCAHPTLVPVP